MSAAHPGRTAAAVIGVIVCALAAIAVTAVIVVPASGDSRPSAQTAPTDPPKLKPMLLDPEEVSELVGRNVKITTDHDALGQPAGPDFAINPAACTSVAFYGQAVTYRNVAWRLARTAQYSASPIVVSQSVVLTASPEVAANFLKEQGQAWERCLGETYRWGTFSAGEHRVLSVEASPGSDRITAVTQKIGDDPGADCGHVMAVKEAYVVEAVTCGYPRYDTNALADDILARIPD